MTTFANYRRYRNLRLKNAWGIAGMNQVVFPFLRGIVIGVVIILAYSVVNGRVQADQQTIDNRVSAELSRQAGMLKVLGEIVAKCTSPGENFITVDNELWACGAVPTGVFVRQ